MEVLLIILQKALENKHIRNFLIVAVLVIFAFIIGMFAVSDAPVEEVCSKYICKKKVCVGEKDALKKQNEKLTSQIEEMQKERYKKEVVLIEEQKAICDVNTAEKIKEIKKSYIKAKCKICKGR